MLKFLNKFINYIVIALLLIFFAANIYLDFTKYAAYRREASGGTVTREKYVTSQAIYTPPYPHYTDSLLIDIIADRDIAVYGEYALFEPFFDSFSKSAAYGEQEINEQELQMADWGLEMGNINLAPYYLLTSMTEEENNYLNEIQREYNPVLYLSGSEVVDETELACIIDSHFNIYVMPKIQSERFLNE